MKKHLVLLVALLFIIVTLFVVGKKDKPVISPESVGIIRRGWADSSFPDCAPGIEWRYMWRPPYISDWSLGCVENVAMLAWGPSTTKENVEARISIIDAKSPGDYVLILNEPDSSDQADISPESAAVWYHNTVVLTIVESGSMVKPLIGGINFNWCGREWLRRFRDTYIDLYGVEPLRAGWHIHGYSDFGPNSILCPNDGHRGQIFEDYKVTTPQQLYEYFAEDLEQTLRMISSWQVNREEIDVVWITEFGCLNAGGHQEQHKACQQSNFMNEYMNLVTGYLNVGPGLQVERYAWYTNSGVGWWTQTWLCKEECNTEYPVWNTWGDTYLTHDVLPTTGLLTPRNFLPIIYD